jgi:hypothetical protein
MKKPLAILFLIIILAGVALCAPAAKNDPYELQVKKLYSVPDEESRLIFDIPIEVKLLDVSTDANWYKVKISFSLGPLGYTYVGWAKIPVGEILAARTEKVADAPASEPTEE